MRNMAKKLAAVCVFAGFLLGQSSPLLAREATLPNTVSNHVQGQRQGANPGQSLGGAVLPANFALDLTSTLAALAANNTRPVTIHFGGSLAASGVVTGGMAQTITPGQLLTSAEYVALEQVLDDGHQSLVLNKQGLATSGFVSLNTADVTGLSLLTIPAHVVVDSIGFNAADPLNVSGAAQVNGSLLALQASAGQSAVLNFGSLAVGPTGLISTSAANSGIAGVFSSSGLTVNSLADLHNQGVITTLGVLAVNSGGAIYNQTAPGSAQAQMVGQSVNLYAASGNFVNSGFISATAGNLNFASAQTANMNVNNAGGVLQATNAMDFRDASYAGSSDLIVSGGTLSAPEVNFYSGTGNVSVLVDEINGTANAYGGSGHVGTTGGALNLGTMDLSGDPVFYNTNGNIVINSSLMIAPGNDLEIVASGNITDQTSGPTGLTISTASGTTAGGNLYIIAGALFTITPTPPTTTNFPGPGDTTSTVAVTGGSTTGGFIDFTQGSGVTNITSSSSAVNKAGGDIGLFAFAGTATGSGVIAMLPASGISAGGNGTGTNGSISVIANGTSSSITGLPSTTTISLGAINNNGGTSISGSSDINIYTNALLVQPAAPVVAPAIAGFVFQNGQYLSGTITPNTATGSLVSSGMAIGAVSSPGSNLNIVAGSGLALNGNIIDNGRVGGGPGGTIVISGATIMPPSTSNMSILANGTGGNPGGSVTITTTDTTNGIISIGTGNSQIAISAQSGPTGSGAGGIVSLTAGSTLSVDAAALTANPVNTGGAGATFTLVSSAGNVNVSTSTTASLNANGVATGTATNGGSITITAAGQVNISAVLTANAGRVGVGGTISINSQGLAPITIGGAGITSALSANGGTVSGNAGKISVTSGGALTFTGTGFTANATNGNGGTIILSAGGTLTLPSSTLNANGATAGNGGTVSLTGSPITVTGGGFFTVNANGVSTGSGGLVTVMNNSTTSDLSIGNSVGAISISAESGTSGGAGGTVDICSARNLFVDPTFLVAGPRGTNGAGPTIILESDGTMNVSSGISANGKGTGAGGMIYLIVETSSISPFNLGGSGTNGVNGALTANGASGGLIDVVNLGADGITLGNVANISVTASTGNGGIIALGFPPTQGVPIPLNTSSPYVTAPTLPFSSPYPQPPMPGPLTITAGATLAANGAGVSGAGGAVNLGGTLLTISGGPLVVSANGHGTGNGGTVNIAVTAPATSGDNLSIGSSASSVSISATSGAGATGNGGTVNVSVGGNLAVDLSLTTNLNAAPASTSGAGGSYTLQAGTNGPGTLFLNNSFNANGVGSGSGGSIVLGSNSSTVFTVNGGAATNGVNGTLSASSGASGGGGGTISITNVGTGGINVPTAVNIIVTPTSGNGGTIDLIAATPPVAGAISLPPVPIGPVTIGSGFLTVNGTGAGNSSGGTIEIFGLTLTVSGGTQLILDANAVNSGSGGTITVLATAPTQSLNVGSGLLEAFATGGTSGGNGGTIKFSAGANLTVDPGFAQAQPLGTNGAGASYFFTAGVSAPGNLLVSNSLSVSGNGTGNAGVMSLNANSTTPFSIGAGTVNGISGAITAAGGTNYTTTPATGGGVMIANTGSIVIANPLTLPGDSLNIAAGGNITTAPGAGAIDVSDPSLPGGISLSAGVNVAQDADGNIRITGKSATGGKVDLNTGTPITSFNAITNSGFGDAFIVALAGSAAGSGTVLMPQLVTINVTCATPSGASANTFSVSVIGGASSGKAVQIGAIDTTSNNGGTGQNGNVLIAAGPTTITDDFVVGQFTSKLNGQTSTFFSTTYSGTATITTGTISTTAAGSGTDGSITVNGPAAITTGALSSNGGAITVSAQGTTGAILIGTATTPAPITSTGGAVTLTGPSTIVSGSIDTTVPGMPTTPTATAGNVTITTASTTIFTVGPVTKNGVNGSITATGGGTTNQGGTISVTNSGTGGISIPNPSNVIAQGVGGANGGSIILSGSPLKFGAGLLSVDATGSVGNGGTITLSGSTITVPNTGNLQLSADGVGPNSTGGNISIATSGAGGNLTIGTGFGQIQIMAQAVTTGGNVTLSSSSRLVINPLGLNATAFNGPTESFTGGAGGVFFTGAFNANGNGGTGGSIIISSSSAGQFIIGTTGSNGVNSISAGALSATGTSGGTISISNSGTGITLKTGASISVASTDGTGGNITLSDAKGPLTMQSPGFVIDASANCLTGCTTAADNGGSVSITASTIVATGSTVTLSANGAGAGGGGSISYTSGGSITVGSGANRITISAISGPNGTVGTTGGNGGSVTLTALGVLSVNPTNLTLDPQVNGQGAIMSFTSQKNIITVSAPLEANGIGAGDGGTISFSQTGSSNFVIGAPAASGVNGSISANAGSTGTGGGITVTTSGIGGITVTALPANLSVAATSGSGGSINLSTATVLSLPAGSISVNAAGTGAFNGGSLILSGNTIPMTTVAITLNADGVGTGNGGSISVSSKSTGSDLSIGPSAGQFTINATGGSAASTSGSGGSVSISSGRFLTVNPGSLDADPTGTDGGGAQLSFTAGNSGSTNSGNIFVTAALMANGVGTGAGGSITFNSASSTTFNVGSAAMGGNGTAGALSANGIGTGAQGGSITINNTGTGGITIPTAANISVAPNVSGAGGTINFSTAGTLNINPVAPLLANATGIGTFNGGSITISASRILVSTTSPLQIMANATTTAGGTGAGGTVSITQTSASQDLTIGSGTGQLEIFAEGNSSGTDSTGNGGTVSLASARNLFIDPDPTTLNALPQGINGNGNGPSYSFTSGSGGTGRTFISGTSGLLNAQGLGTGTGGSVTISTVSSVPFVVGTPTTNGVVGSINVAAGAISGSGGSLSLTSSGTGGINITSSSNIVSNATNGAGATLSFTTGTGNLTIGAGNPLEANAVFSGSLASTPTGGFAGGTITIASGKFIITGGTALQMNASGAGAMNGGSISVTTSNTAGALNVGNGVGQFEVFAQGGSAQVGCNPASTAGAGGTLTLSAGSVLTINSQFMNASPMGTTGNGATITLTGGGALTSASNGNVAITGTIDASGVGSANGGTITITANSRTTFIVSAPTTLAGANGISGNLIANSGSVITAGQSNVGGTIDISSGGNFQVNAGALVEADGATAPISSATSSMTTTTTSITSGVIQYQMASKATNKNVTAVINGTVIASTPISDTVGSAGVIGFVVPAGGNVTVTGSGMLLSGRSTGFGNLVSGTLIPNTSNAGTISISHLLHIGVTLLENGKTFKRTAFEGEEVNEAVVDTGDIDNDDDGGAVALGK